MKRMNPCKIARIDQRADEVTIKWTREGNSYELAPLSEDRLIGNNYLVCARCSGGVPSEVRATHELTVTEADGTIGDIGLCSKCANRVVIFNVQYCTDPAGRRDRDHT